MRLLIGNKAHLNDAPDSGMNPTANQRECHRELVRHGVECAAGDDGREALTRKAGGEDL